MGKLKSKVLLGLIAIIMIVPVVTPLFGFGSQKARAANTYAFEAVNIRAITWSVINSLVGHGNIIDPTQPAEARGCALNYRIPGKDAADNKFWRTAALNENNTKTRVGTHVGGNGGVVTCGSDEWSIIWSVINSWGYTDPITFLKALGYKYDEDDDIWQRSGAPDVGTFTGNSAIPGVGSLINDSFFAGSRNAAPKDVVYYIYYTNLMNGCDAVSQGPLSSLTSDTDKYNLAHPAESGWYSIKEVDTTNGAINNVVYKIDPNKNVVIGWGVPSDGSDDGVAGCDWLAEQLKGGNGLAQAFSDYVKDILLAGGEPIDNDGSEGGDENVDKCGGLSGLGWLLCPIIMLMDGAIHFLDTQIKSLLTINLEDYDAKAQTGLKTAWSAIRIISTVLMVGLALVVIIAQMVGSDIFSAYTIKKMVPKLVIAIILIQLSWVIMMYGIEIVNVIGAGLQDLLFMPFGGAKQLSNVGPILEIANIGGGEQSGVVLFGVGIGAIIVASGGGALFVVLAAAVGVAIAVIVAVATLLLRKIIIIGLIIIAPLAILAWVLPNTEKYFKWWWSNLTKLLLMFPLIMGILALGAIFAFIIASTRMEGTSAQLLKFIFILVSFYGVYFLIPKTFSLSGSLMASASGALNKVGSKTKGGVMESSPVKRYKESHDQNRRLAGIERAASSQNRFSKAYGRMQAGTFGATGRYGKILATKEKQQAYSDASMELQSDLEQKGITGYDEKKKFYAAAARGDDSVNLVDSKGQTQNVKLRKSTTKQTSATTWLADHDLDDELRTAKVAQYSKGQKHVWAAAGETHGGKIAAIANDTTDRDVAGLSSGQMASQGAGTLRNYAAESEAASIAASGGDASAAGRVHDIAIAARATLADKSVEHDLTPEKRAHLEYMAALDTAKPIARTNPNKDYAGRKGATPAAGVYGTPGYVPARAADEGFDATHRTMPPIP